MRHPTATSLPFDTTTRRRLALEALVTDKTLARFFRGESVNNATRHRIERAALAVGVTLPAPAAEGAGR